MPSTVKISFAPTLLVVMAVSSFAIVRTAWLLWPSVTFVAVMITECPTSCLHRIVTNLLWTKTRLGSKVEIKVLRPRKATRRLRLQYRLRLLMFFPRLRPRRCLRRLRTPMRKAKQNERWKRRKTKTTRPNSRILAKNVARCGVRCLSSAHERRIPAICPRGSTRSLRLATLRLPSSRTAKLPRPKLQLVTPPRSSRLAKNQRWARQRRTRKAMARRRNEKVIK
mmetsp:Transcript_93320/g.260944  ORF Transcript_93320/g.260944 Transcript_93320/m.260944 type:complete len:224 (-) Transcript_93320:580-1251(-)